MRIKGLDEALELIEEAIDQLPAQLFMDIGTYAAKRIQMKARQGRTMISGTEQPMPPLSAKYIERRKEWKNAFKENVKRLRMDKSLHYKQDDFNYGGIGHNQALKDTHAQGVPDLDYDFFSPARSNLTVTGQYLSAIQTTNIDQRQRLITIASVGTRTDGKTNEALSKYLSDKGRSIWNIDTTAKKVITQKVIDQLRRSLRLKK